MGVKHYHAGYNTEGYLPDEDRGVFLTKAEAVADAKRVRDEILEEGYGPMLPEGTCSCDHHRSEHAHRGRGRCSAPDCTCTRYEGVGLRSRGSNGDYWIGDDDPGHLDVHVWVTDCFESECSPEED